MLSVLVEFYESSCDSATTQEIIVAATNKLLLFYQQITLSIICNCLLSIFKYIKKGLNDWTVWIISD